MSFFVKSGDRHMFFDIAFKGIFVRFKAFSPLWNITTPFFRDNATVEIFLRTNFHFFLIFLFYIIFKKP